VIFATEICDMNDKDKRLEIGTEEHREWIRKRAEKRWKEIAESGPAEFDENGLISGSEKALTSTDAELFPDEIEEYKPEERKPRLIPNKKD